MKIHSKLDELLKQSSKIKILRFLFFAKDEHTGRAIARAIGMSASSTYETLQSLKKESLITIRKKGNAILYKIRSENYIIKELLIPLFEKEKFMFTEIITLIKGSLLEYKDKIASIALFGSVARKEETTKSDIDLVIIIETNSSRKAIDNAIDELSMNIAKKFGTDLSPYVITRDEIRKKYNRKQPLIRSILKDNHLIYGEPIERIIA